MNKNHATTKLFHHHVKCSKSLVISQVLFWYWIMTKSRLIKTQKRTRPMLRNTVRKSLDNKGFIIRNFFLTGQIDRPIFARVTNQNKGFTSSCTLAEPAI